MKILCRATPPVIQAGPMVNKLGKYLNKNLVGAFKFRTSSNMCDVYLTFLFQRPWPGLGNVDDVHEITMDINITTYANKVRVNIIEMTPQERTLACVVLDPNKIGDLEVMKQKVETKVRSSLDNAYEGYEILY
ncbi:hypothetical protein [uncultured Duncaniella sp.]|uniref:hypothetical protein n=1 Tax=uncultured Duncaniella sp. TaxID=2768039 RepID=UPI002634E58B|nr:hypothetical protein [uncultured Duncaniella sp.]